MAKEEKDPECQRGARETRCPFGGSHVAAVLSVGCGSYGSQSRQGSWRRQYLGTKERGLKEEGNSWQQ